MAHRPPVRQRTALCPHQEKEVGTQPASPPLPSSTVRSCSSDQQAKQCSLSLNAPEQPLLFSVGICRQCRMMRMTKVGCLVGGTLASSLCPYSLGKCWRCPPTYKASCIQRQVSEWAGRQAINSALQPGQLAGEGAAPSLPGNGREPPQMDMSEYTPPSGPLLY